MADVFEMNPEQTEFSGGLAKIFRLDAIQKQIHIARVNKLYPEWYEWLLSKYLELEVFIKKGEVDSHTKAVTKMRDDFFSINSLLSKKQSVPYQKVESFLELEILLSKLESSNGLGMKKTDSRYGS